MWNSNLFGDVMQNPISSSSLDVVAINRLKAVFTLFSLSDASFDTESVRCTTDPSFSQQLSLRVCKQF